jgi:hypothetical protein
MEALTALAREGANDKIPAALFAAICAGPAETEALVG